MGLLHQSKITVLRPMVILSNYPLKFITGTSLAVQRLTLHFHYKGTWVWSLVRALSGEVNGTPFQYSWKIPWAEEPRRLQSMGSLSVRRNCATSLSLFTFMHWRRKWQSTPVFLPGESQGWGRTESDTTERLSSSSKGTELSHACHTACQKIKLLQCTLSQSSIGDWF